MNADLRVLTWNILHRVHAENYSEPAISAWPEEADRMEAIARWLARSTAEVICLQEVSGDQLERLRAALPGDVHAFVYPRVPSFRRGGGSLKDVREHLVIAVRTGGSRVIGSAAFASDPGKGFLAVELAGGAVVVDTHVTYGEKLAGQLKELAAFAKELPRVVICGDFNAPLGACAQCFGSNLEGAVLSPSELHTRPRQKDAEKSQDIDHVFVRGMSLLAARIEDGEKRSDHNPVIAELSSAAK